MQTADGNACYYAYDASSKVVRKELGNAVTAYMAYDVAERVTAIHYAQSDGTPVAYFDYAWDLGSRITKIQHYGALAAYTTYHGYDYNDRLISEVWQSGGAQTNVRKRAVFLGDAHSVDERETTHRKYE